MRNLKKILALVLALMMTVSLMVVASAASYDDYSDKEQIDETYAEAVEVLAGIGIYQGDTEGTFRPQDTLTRAEVATLLYRLLTGDVTDSKVDTYAGYDEFTDVPSTEWYAGFVNYAYVKGWVIGNGDGTYGPNDNVTGVELATMLVRALGRDVNGEEIGGDDWELKASVLAAKADLNKNLPSVFMSKDATREQTAQMIFNALKVETWEYNGHIYEPTGNSLIGLKDSYDFDVYGRPSKVWSWGNNVISAGSVSMEVEPLVEYTTAVDQCTVADDLGLTAKANYRVMNNGNAANSGEGYWLPANGTGVGVDLGTDSKSTTSAAATGTGVLTQVYASPNYGKTGAYAAVEYIVVEIDTYLAQVVGTTPAKFDGKGHLEEPATLYLNVYDQDNGTASLRYLTNGATDYAYTAGQMLLLNGVSYSATNDQLKSAAGISYNSGTYYVLVNAEIVDVATSFVGAQSKVYSDNSRDVAGYVEKPSNVQFNHDATVNPADGKPVVSTTNYTWYMDQYNNLIGAFEIENTYSYGVIQDIQWINPSGASGYARATIRYVNGETGVVTVDKLCGADLTYSTPGVTVGLNGGKWVVSTSMDENISAYFGTALYQIEDKGNGHVELLNVTQAGAGSIDNDSGEAQITISGGTIPVNSNTLFIVRTTGQNGYIYTNYEGFLAVPDISATTIDWVAAADGSARYVYVVGSVDPSVGSNLVYIKNADKWFYNNDKVNCTLTDAYVNGAQTDIVIPSTMVSALTDNTVYMVSYSNGVVASAPTAIGASPVQVDATNNIWAVQTTITALESDVVVAYGQRWTTNDTPVYGGELTVGANIVLVGGIGGNHDATAIYVLA